jgi:prolyl-tRNA synthetase
MKNKKLNFSEWYTEVTKEAKLCDLRYNVKGFVVFMPWSVITMKKMYKIYEEELEKTGHLPAWFPALIPESNFKKESEHVEGFTPQVFWVEKAGDNKVEERLAMRPTSETAIYQMYSLWIQGKSDLPIKIYHSSQVWRYETKATRPFIRSREFYWIETHDAFETRQEAENQVKEDMQISKKVIFERFGIPFIFFQRPEWDKFPGALATYAADCLMPDGKVLQLPSTHLLGQNFAKAFDVKFLDENGKREYCWQTCYGPAISRIYAALISTHGDDQGLVLPFELAPIQIIIIPIPTKENKEEIEKKAEEIEKLLIQSGLTAQVDFSENTPGYKFNYWEMKGVPFRIEIGTNEIKKDEYLVVRRDNRKKSKIKKDKLVEYIKEETKKQFEEMKKKAEEEFNKKISSAESIEKLSEELEKGKLVAVNFCSTGNEGKNCAAYIKEKTSGDIRGTRFDRQEEPKGNCIVCGKKANALVYVARQY